MAGIYLSPGGIPRRRGAVRDADLRSGRAADGGRPRPVELRRHRRRSCQRTEARRRSTHVQRRPADRGGDHGRRDRRLGRGDRGALGEGPHEKTGRGLHRRNYRAARKAHGPRRRHHLRRQGHRAGKPRRHGGVRHQGDAQPRGDGEDPKIHTQVIRFPLLASLPYAATIFLSSFLLFLVQPIIAKQILPWFGGSAAVWTTCLVFFQSVLLAGYAYADLTHRLGARRQALLHVGLLALSLAFLPVLASSGWKPQGDEQPIARILLLLLATIGLPYFLLSTTTPLLQAWYWRRFRSRVPYRLFALSNLASLLALIGFPLLFEPALDLRQLGWMWSFVFAGFVVLCALTARLSMNGFGTDEVSAAARAAPLSMATQLQWLALAAMGSVMLLAVTHHITHNASSAPVPWGLPLAPYLRRSEESRVGEEGRA